MKQIRQLTDTAEIPSLVKLVGGNKALEDELHKEFELSVLRGNRMFIRYDWHWLQRMQISEELFIGPEQSMRMTDYVLDHASWRWRTK